MHTHDLGRWTRHLGYPVNTPNLDALASRATCFTNAFAAAPTCSPSRAALLTGQMPHNAGMLGLAHRGFSLAHPERHLGNLLADTGYDTILSGIQHEFSGPDAEGFPYRQVLPTAFKIDGESPDEFQIRRDRSIAEAAVEFLSGEAASAGPFFLSVGFFQPHRPLLTNTAGAKEFAGPVPPMLDDTPAVREDLASLRTSIEHLDNQVGNVLNAIRENGHWENSTIIFTTDHGIAFPRHKCCLTASGLGTSLLIRHPEKTGTHGKTLDAMVSHLDVLPTLFGWLGIDPPEWLEGCSLDPLITGSTRELHEACFGEVNFHAAYEPMRSIRTRSHCLVRYFLTDHRWILANVDDSPSKEEWLNSRNYREGRKPVELYDLEADPHELVNRADDPALASIKSDLMGQLDSWMRATDDPLLGGELDRPENTVVNHPDSISPHEQFFEQPAGTSRGA